MSAWPGDQSGSGKLKGTITYLPKPDERLPYYTLSAERLEKYKLKEIIK